MEKKQNKSKQPAQLNAEIDWLYDWFEAWKLISKGEFEIGKAKPPEMLFFDDKYVYTNSKTSAPNGQKIKGPTLYEKEIVWYKQSHNDSITIPDGQKVPIQIMTFAAPSEKAEVESFFVMAAPSFWKNAGIDSEEVGLKNMLIGVFLHEFAHTRQMNGIGAKITDYEKKHKFDFVVSDDIIQDYFSDDSLYVQLFREQTEAVYKLLNKPTKEIQKAEIAEILQKFALRQQKFLTPKKEILPEMDRIFLTMEGVGQYAMVTWLTHRDGGGFSEQVAIKATRRGKSWWSQEEGLALVLLYKKIAQQPNWKSMFSQEPIDIITLIEQELNDFAN